MTWDVTNDVQSFIDGTQDNHGWIIMDTTTWRQFNIPIMYFYAKEFDSLTPYLEIEVMHQDEKQPIACWNFDEGSGNIVHDCSEYGNDGTNYGGRWVPGVSSTALELTDYDIVRYIPSSFDDPISTAFSIECWVSFYGESPHRSYGIVFDGRDGYGRTCGMNLNIIKRGLFRLQIPDGNECHLFYSKTPLPVDSLRFTHIAATYDYSTQTVNMYFNGKLDTTYEAPFLFCGTILAGAIGNNRWAPGDHIWCPLNGIVDELALFNYALSPEEIWEHYTEYAMPVVTPTNEWINVFCGQPEFNGISLSPGDIIMAYDSDNIPCGMDSVRGDGSFGFMPVYRDDIYTDTDEGAEPGENISFTINDEEVFTASPIIWTENGDCFELCTFSTERCVNIPLHQGWNFISWNVAYADEIENLLTDFSDCVDVIFSFDQGALTYDPELPEFASLTEVNQHHGYWLRMECNATLEVCGSPINKNDYIVIHNGWNLVGYWPEDILNTEDGFASILDNLRIALGFDNGGLTWSADNPQFSTLADLRPNFGYWALSSADNFLIYPGYSGIVPANSGICKTYSNEVYASRQWMSLYGRGIMLDGAELRDNAVIEVFTQDDILCGKSTYANGILKFMPVYGYDKLDEKTFKYPQMGDSLSVYIDGIPVSPKINWESDASRIQIEHFYNFEDNMPVEFILAQNYPNPFNPVTTIEFTLPAASEWKMTIYNIAGQKVTKFEGYSEAGRSKVDWDASGCASGIYFYKLEAGEFSMVKKMTLLK